MEAIDFEANKSQPSQSTNIAWSYLPPLSPHSDPIQDSNPNLSVDEINYHFQVPLQDKKYGLSPRKTHRRSSSDVPLGFSAMIQSTPQLIPISAYAVLVKQEAKSEEKSGENGKVINLENTDLLHSSGIEDKDSECSEDEVESKINGKIRNEIAKGMKNEFSIKKSELGRRKSYVRGDIVPHTRHVRCMSMDSFMGGLDLDDEPGKLGLLGTRIGQQSSINLMDANLLKYSLEFGNGVFTGAELKKITANDKLAEIALSEPRRAKRILANRQSAARSKERKMRYISELELKVQILQTEASTLSTELAVTQRETCGLSSQNNELKFRLQAIEQQAKLKDALNGALTAEVKRLKAVASET